MFAEINIQMNEKWKISIDSFVLNEREKNIEWLNVEWRSFQRHSKESGVE